MTAAEEHRFRELLERYFAARGQRFERTSQGLFLDGAPAPAWLLLEALAAECTRSRPREWETVVTRHLEGALIRRSAREGDLLPLGAALELILALPQPTAAIPRLQALSGNGGLVYRRDLAGLVTVLCLAGTSDPRPVSRREFLAWGRRPSELFRVGLRNVRDRLQLEARPVALADGSVARLVRSEVPWVPACAYFLPRIEGTCGAVGSLFSILDERHLLAAPIDAPARKRSLAQLVLEEARRRGTEPLPVQLWDGRRFYVEGGLAEGG